jgi:hypothetical protein
MMLFRLPERLIWPMYEGGHPLKTDERYAVRQVSCQNRTSGPKQVLQSSDWESNDRVIRRLAKCAIVSVPTHRVI